MKSKAIILTALLTAATVGTISSLVAYRAGMHRTLGLQKGVLVSTIDALQKLRRGEPKTGIQRLESMCFVSAVLLLDDREYAGNSTVKLMIPELVAYRHRYRTNQSEWSPVEQRLEVLLARHR